MLRVYDGQIWRLKNPTKNCCFVSILKFCPHSGPEYVHVAILDEHFEVEVAHAPFLRTAVENSVDQLVLEKTNKDYSDEGFLIWEREFLNGGAGYYNILVVDACA